VWPGPHLVQPRGPLAEVSAAVQAASRARAGHQRQGRRRREVAVAQRVRRGRRGLAHSAVVTVRRALGPGRATAWEQKAAQPSGCWRGAGSTAVPVACPWVDRLRLLWPHRRPVGQCRRRPDGPADCLESQCLGSTAMTRARWGCRCPANLKARPRLARTEQDQDRRQPAESRMAGGWPRLEWVAPLSRYVRRELVAPVVSGSRRLESVFPLSHSSRSTPRGLVASVVSGSRPLESAALLSRRAGRGRSAVERRASCHRHRACPTEPSGCPTVPRCCQTRQRYSRQPRTQSGPLSGWRVPRL
jgi:hypothetical protein